MMEREAIQGPPEECAPEEYDFSVFQSLSVGTNIADMGQR
jgi:hypothetical protein